MSARRTAGGFSPVHLLLLVAFLEVAVNRVAVPMLRPAKGAPPTWHTVLDYGGLFLFYFTGTLAVFLIAAHIVRRIQHGSVVTILSQVALAAAGLLAAVPLVIHAPAALSIPLESAFAIAVLLLLASAIRSDHDLGAQLGLLTLALPLLLHTFAVFAAKYSPEHEIDGHWGRLAVDAVVLVCLVTAFAVYLFTSRREGRSRREALAVGSGVGLLALLLMRLSIAKVGIDGVLFLSLAALISPYVFAPRPFARAVTRPGPVVFAMGIAALGAVIARMAYTKVAKAASLAFGVELSTTHADPRLALYLLAIATLAWTLASCAFATSTARRQIGNGIALVVLGGYSFHWPHHYLLPMFGFALVADAITRVRDEELAAMPIVADTPPIPDTAWSAYIASVKAGLEKTLANVHTLTSRGDGGLSSSVIVGDRDGLQVRTRIERIDGAVIALDVVVGREFDEVRGATLTIWAMPPRELGINPAGPPAAPLFKTNDAAFDERFKARGNRLSLERLMPEPLRARAVATLDGWLAYWAPESVRYRVYPGQGAPLDHPIPLSDLALGRTATPDRLVAVIELLVEIAQRGIVRDAPLQPTALDAEPSE